MNGALFAIQVTEDDLKVLRIRRENGVVSASAMAHERFGLGEREGEDGSAHLAQLQDVRKLIPENAPQALLVLDSLDLEFRELSFPFEAERKVRNAIDFELSTDYPEDTYLHDHVKALAREPGYHSFISAQIERSRLAARTSLLERAGFQVAGITADVSTLGAAFRDEEEALLMSTGERHTLFALYRFGVPVLLRKLPIGVRALQDEGGRVNHGGFQQFTAEIKRTIHSFNAKAGLDLDRLHVTGNLLLFDELCGMLRERVKAEVVIRRGDAFDVLVEAEPDSEGANVFAALVGAAHWRRKDGSFHFLKEEFVGREPALSGPRLLRWGSGLAIAFVLLLLLSYGLNLVALKERQAFLHSEIRKTFTSAFPQVGRIVDELKQARNLLEAEASSGLGANPQGGPSLLEAFRGISAAIPPDVAFEIVSLFWETGKIEIYGRTDSFRTVNAIQELLTAPEGISQVSISNARYREEGQDVEFKLSIRLSG